MYYYVCIIFFKEALKDEENNDKFAILCTSKGLILVSIVSKKKLYGIQWIHSCDMLTTTTTKITKKQQKWQT